MNENMSTEITAAVARFVTKMPVVKMTESRFIRYVDRLETVCKDNKQSIHLEDAIFIYAEEYVTDEKKLVRGCEQLAWDVREAVNRYSMEDGHRFCRVCRQRLPIALFRVRSSGSLETACVDCEREERRAYQAGRMRKRTCALV
jgi:hypothetical protein